MCYGQPIKRYSQTSYGRVGVLPLGNTSTKSSIFQDIDRAIKNTAYPVKSHLASFSIFDSVTAGNSQTYQYRLVGKGTFRSFWIRFYNSGMNLTYKFTLQGSNVLDFMTNSTQSTVALDNDEVTIYSDRAFQANQQFQVDVVNSDVAKTMHIRCVITVEYEGQSDTGVAG